MTWHYGLARRARRDIDSICDWYDSQRAGLADEFLEEFKATCCVICARPNSFPAVLRGIRATRCDRFPYKIYFQVTEDRIDIVAVYHSARDPRRWADPERE